MVFFGLTSEVLSVKEHRESVIDSVVKNINRTRYLHLDHSKSDSVTPGLTLFSIRNVLIDFSLIIMRSSLVAFHCLMSWCSIFVLLASINVPFHKLS